MAEVAKGHSGPGPSLLIFFPFLKFLYMYPNCLINNMSQAPFYLKTLGLLFSFQIPLHSLKHFFMYKKRLYQESPVLTGVPFIPCTSSLYLFKTYSQQLTTIKFLKSHLCILSMELTLLIKVRKYFVFDCFFSQTLTIWVFEFVRF